MLSAFPGVSGSGAGQRPVSTAGRRRRGFDAYFSELWNKVGYETLIQREGNPARVTAQACFISSMKDGTK